MPKNITMYDLLLSCPSDVPEEILDTVNNVVEEFNQHFQDNLGIGIRVCHWSKSSFAESGGKPQDLLNKQFVEDCDVAVAIFKTRFGTPTDKYKSGTEEEIEILLNEGRQVFLYFDESPVTPGYDSEQYRLVQEFKEKYRSRGIYGSFTSSEQFRKMFYAHVTQYFLTKEKVDAIEQKNRPELTLKSYNYSELKDVACICPFILFGDDCSKAILEDIRSLYKSINEYNLQITRMSDAAFVLGSPVSIDEDTKSYIGTFAECFKIELSEDFFRVGNLKKGLGTSLSLYGSSSLEGTKEEKEKYHKIQELRDKIILFFSRSQLEKLYAKLTGVQFVLCNTGTQYDQDIDIELFFPAGVLIEHYNLPVPDSKIEDDDWSFEVCFGIGATRLFKDYFQSKMQHQPFHVSSPSLPIFGGRDYEKEYQETLDDLYEFEYYDRDDGITMKLHIDYIKQHQSVAFPAWVFVKNEEFDLQYQITSKNNPSIVEGCIKTVPCVING